MRSSGEGDPAMQRRRVSESADNLTSSDRCLPDSGFPNRFGSVLSFSAQPRGFTMASVTLDQPEAIGPYHVLQVIGEGGMGIVYEAEQREPVRRRVAIKMLKAGMDSKQVLGRFEIERQSLAVMDHPGIARVFDAGVDAGGRPYFAMELVAGVAVDEYCSLKRLTIRQRLELISAVCEAVQHAHQK